MNDDIGKFKTETEKRLALLEFFVKQTRSTVVMHEATLIALRKFIAIRCARDGEAPEIVWEEFDALAKKVHGEFLRRIEDRDPATAADLDERWPPTDD